MIKLNHKGVTLVELLIYLGLASIILIVLSELFVSILNESVETQNYSAVQTDGRYILARLRYAINNADSITVPTNLGDSAEELILTTNGVQVAYFISDSKLYLSDDTGNYLVSNLDTKITDTAFTRQGNVNGKPVIAITLVVASGVSTAQQYESQVFVGAGGLR